MYQQKWWYWVANAITSSVQLQNLLNKIVQTRNFLHGAGKKSTDLLLVVSQQLPPWGGVVHAGDPIICQLLPDVEYFLGFVVGQLATVPLSGVKQCRHPTLIAAVGKKENLSQKFKTKKDNVLYGTVQLLMCHCATTYVPLCNYWCSTVQLTR